MSKPKADDRPQTSQYVFRASTKSIVEIKKKVARLHEKFNADRDDEDPKGVISVKRGEIEVKAMELGLIALGKKSKWEFE